MTVIQDVAALGNLAFKMSDKVNDWLGARRASTSDSRFLTGTIIASSLVFGGIVGVGVIALVTLRERQRHAGDELIAAATAGYYPTARSLILRGAPLEAKDNVRGVPFGEHTLSLNAPRLASRPLQFTTTTTTLYRHRRKALLHLSGRPPTATWTCYTFYLIGAPTRIARTMCVRCELATRAAKHVWSA